MIGGDPERKIIVIPKGVKFSGSRRLRIVIADCDTAIRNFYEDTERQLGHDVVGVASNRQQAIDLCRATHPDVLLVGVGMTDSNTGAEASGSEVRSVDLLSDCLQHEDLGGALDQLDLADFLKSSQSEGLDLAVALVLHDLADYQALRREVAELRQAVQALKALEAGNTPAFGQGRRHQFQGPHHARHSQDPKDLPKKIPDKPQN